MNDSPEYYYLNQSNQVVGPFSMADIEKLARGRIITEETLICRVGSEEWSPLSSVAIFTTTNAIVSRPAPPRAVAQKEPSGGLRRGVALTLSIVSVPMACVPFLGLISAIAGLAMGIKGLRQGQHNGMAASAISTAGIGILLGMVSTLFFLSGSSDPAGSPSVVVAAKVEQVQRIARVMQERSAILDRTLQAYKGDLPSAVEIVAQELQNLDVSDCPPDFQVAYQKHAEAWGEAVPYLAANTPFSEFMEGFYGGYTGDWSVLGLSERQAQQAAQRIFDTEEKMLAVAATYGVRTRKRRPE